MSDPRFARLTSDPRFRRPRKKKSKIVIDDRFKHIIGASKKGKVKSAGVDKYGRPISTKNDNENLRRFYRLENEEDSEIVQDYARGEVLLESSDEEEQEDSQEDSDSGEVISIGHHHSQPSPVNSDNLEVDLDESSFSVLDAQAAAYNESHPEIQQPQISPTHRLAVVNLDWDHVRASHLYTICSSVVSPTVPASKVMHTSEGKKSPKRMFSSVVRGKVVSVRVYPSEFGQQRMAREEKEGPPPEIFKKNRFAAEEEITPRNVYEVGDGNDYDEGALRKYQLERLRYYYAIITCDTVETAEHIYTELEGAELERSANVFDLSFVPNDMAFDDVCRDEATSDTNTTCKAVNFVTDALRHSKVKLTWDDDDPERNRITRRTLTKAEIEESDFKAFLASSSDSETDAVSRSSGNSKENIMKASRHKLRALLLGGDDDLPEGWSCDANQQEDVDMEITFTPGLSEKKDCDETTLEKYQRKTKEKRNRKKVEAKEKVFGEKSHSLQDEFFEDGGGRQHGSSQTSKLSASLNSATNPQSLSDTASRPLSTPEELKLLVSSNTLEGEHKHFNIKSVMKAEKNLVRKRKIRKKNHRQEDDNELQNDFSIDVKDARFKALHDDHQYAIDPSNPQFMKTQSMVALLEERSRRQRELLAVDFRDVPVHESEGNAERGLISLVESIKRKGATLPSQGIGKRRRI